MAPRGLKVSLKNSAPCKLVGSGAKKHFEIKHAGASRGIRLRGLTKRLQTCIFSDGEMPSIAKTSAPPAGGHWRGADGGRRRGRAVDSQVSRLSDVSCEKRYSSKMLNLTRMVFSALSVRGLEPIVGQRAVCSQLHRVGTAADVVCYDLNTNELVVVELKCGHSGARTAAAIKSGNACTMKGPLRMAPDSTLNRHLAQLAVTHHLLTSEAATMRKLANIGVDGVRGLLMYANDTSVDVYDLDEWWISKAGNILSKLK